jgi:hypothetical protein
MITTNSSRCAEICTTGACLSTLVRMCPDPEQNIPPEGSTPRQLRELWLRYHEKELCQDLDTVFVFHPRGVEIWCLAEDEKSYQRFSEMMEPMRGTFEIEVYLTRPMPEKKSRTEDDPPPSLWNNVELQTFLQDTSHEIFGPGSTDPPTTERRSAALKQKLAMWAGQLVIWNKKFSRYAADLPDLAHAGFAHGGTAEIKSRAAAVLRSHAQALDKNAARIIEYLSQALPRPDKGSRRSAEPEGRTLPDAPVELAALISTNALTVSRRIHRFLYPQDFTVGLTDLKDPTLLESLRDLRSMFSRLQQRRSAHR